MTPVIGGFIWSVVTHRSPGCQKVREASLQIACSALSRNHQNTNRSRYITSTALPQLMLLSECIDFRAVKLFKCVRLRRAFCLNKMEICLLDVAFVPQFCLPIVSLQLAVVLPV